MHRLYLQVPTRTCFTRALSVHVNAARANVAPRRARSSNDADPGSSKRASSFNRQPREPHKSDDTVDNPRQRSAGANRSSSPHSGTSTSRRSPPRHANSDTQSDSNPQRRSATGVSDVPFRARDILLKRKPAVEQQSAPPAVTQQLLQLEQQHDAAGAADPTFVPRNPAVKDGPWNEIDAQLVEAAQQDAQLLPSSPTAAVAAVEDHVQQQQQQQQIDLSGHVLLGQSVEQLSQLAQQLGQPAYRGKQLLDGILKGAHRTTDIKGIPKPFAQQLEALGVKTGRSVIHHKVGAPDGTVKLLLQLEEGRVIETVGIPVLEEGKQRLTVCVSSQVGCPMRCTFCATGKGGFARNLRPHEIIDQVLTISEVFGGQRVSNVVFMGMGEPLLNIPGVTAAVSFLQQQLGMSGRAITISTVGMPNAILKLAQHKLTSTLAVSIHAPNQQLREQLIPSARVYPITALMSDCSSYFRTTKRRVTFEYTLMAGTNDKPEHAEELAALLKRYKLMSHVNLIPWNPVDESDYRRPSRNSVLAFQKVLEAAGLPVSVRSTRGLEAAAACGQLRNRFQKQGLENPIPLL